MTDIERYRLAQSVMMDALARLTLPGVTPAHAVAGLACALRAMAVPERDIRSSLAGVLLVGPTGAMLPASNAHADIDHAHALMTLPPGSVSRGGDG
jgi:hypothetical protein